MVPTISEATANTVVSNVFVGAQVSATTAGNMSGALKNSGALGIGKEFIVANNVSSTGIHLLTGPSDGNGTGMFPTLEIGAGGSFAPANYV